MVWQREATFHQLFEHGWLSNGGADSPVVQMAHNLPDMVVIDLEGGVGADLFAQM